MKRFLSGLWFRLKLKIYMLFFGDKLDESNKETINEVYSRKAFDQADVVFLEWNWKKYLSSLISNPIDISTLSWFTASQSSISC